VFSYQVVSKSVESRAVAELKVTATDTTLLTTALQAAGDKALATFSVAVAPTATEGAAPEMGKKPACFGDLSTYGVVDGVMGLVMLLVFGVPAVLLMVSGEKSPTRSFHVQMAKRTSMKMAMPEEVWLRVLASRISMGAFIQAGLGLFLCFGSWPFGGVAYVKHFSLYSDFCSFYVQCEVFRETERGEAAWRASKRVIL
jgi:hypothetical protein